MVGLPLRYCPGHGHRRFYHIPEGQRWCSQCTQVRIEADFYREGPRKGSNRTGICRFCRSDLDKTPERTAVRRDARFRRLYGLFIEDYEDLLTRQKGTCAVCRRPETQRRNDGSVRELTVDHDHTTGKVRGLLCGNCNRAIGLFRDDPARLQAAIRYLKKPR